MSVLSEKTEEKAIAVLAECVQLFEKLHYLEMAAGDDYDATAAANLLKGVIESNGYKMAYTKSRKAKPYCKA